MDERDFLFRNNSVHGVGLTYEWACSNEEFSCVGYALLEIILWSSLLFLGLLLPLYIPSDFH
jgi:hypothetical protein